MLVPTVKAIFISSLLNYLSSFVCFAYHTCTSPFSVPTRKSWNYCALQFFLALAVAQTGGYLPSHTDLIVVD